MLMLNVCWGFTRNRMEKACWPGFYSLQVSFFSGRILPAGLAPCGSRLATLGPLLSVAPGGPRFHEAPRVYSEGAFNNLLTYGHWA